MSTLNHTFTLTKGPQVKDFDRSQYTIIINTDMHGRIVAESASIAKCVEAWEMVRDDHRVGGLGMSNMRKGCGNLYHGGKKIGNVSYNGRVWDNNDNEMLVGDK